jgi:chloramphenicol-sensitive protein RarD
MTRPAPDRTGMIYAAGAHVLWGIVPIYWKQIEAAGAVEIVAHRIVWTVVFTVIIIALQRRLGRLWSALRDPRAVLALAASSLLIALNWGLFIWAVMENRIIDTSLGYFINPLLSILLGVVMLQERLSLLQKIAVGVAGLGVVNQTLTVGYLPWISLLLATSFALYGFIRKTIHVESIEGVSIETILMLPMAGAFLVYLIATGEAAFGRHGVLNDFYLVLAGPLTAIPLMLFAAGARRLPMFMMGFMQYVTPTLSLSVAVFMYDETFTHSHAITFGLIWSALALVSWEAFRRERYSAA